MSLIELKVPDIGGHENVDIIAVEIKAGDTIAIDDTLITLETDKATMLSGWRESLFYSLFRSKFKTKKTPLLHGFMGPIAIEPIAKWLASEAVQRRGRRRAIS